jgi:hypothetical protein
LGHRRILDEHDFAVFGEGVPVMINLAQRACFIAIQTVLLSQLAVPAGAEPIPASGLADTRVDAADESPLQDLAVAKGKRLESLMGVEVRTRVEESVGRIIDLLADRTGEVQAAVIEFGGFLGIGTRKIAVEWSALRLVGAGKQTIVILDVTRDELRLAPEYKPHEPTVVRRVTD